MLQDYTLQTFGISIVPGGHSALQLSMDPATDWFLDGHAES
jgi:hypothetical protein